VSGEKCTSNFPEGVIRKPDPRSVLKTPECPERMAAIYGYLAGNPETQTKGHTYTKTIEWLAKQDIKVTQRALCEFRRWYGGLWLPMQRAADVTKWAEEFLKDHPELNLRRNQVAILCQIFFEVQALETKNVDLHLALKKAAQKDEALKIGSERLKLLRDREQEAKEPPKEKLSPEEKERRIKAVFGITA